MSNAMKYIFLSSKYVNPPKSEKMYEKTCKIAWKYITDIQKMQDNHINCWRMFLNTI